LLDDGVRRNEMMCGEENFLFVLGQLEKPRQNKNLLYQHGKSNEPTKEGPLSFVLFESPFTSVSKVSRGHPSLVSMCMISSNSGEVLSLAYVQKLLPRQRYFAVWY
jgi:hypothetical protein